MLQFMPMRIKSGTVLGEEGFYIEEVFLLLTGCVLRESTREAALGLPPHYLTEGAIFGERIFLDKELKNTNTAVCDSILFKIPK